jgi:hypothetical protein
MTESPITIHFDDAGVRKEIFSLPPTGTPDMPSVLAFALPKAGSVLLDGLLRRLCGRFDMTYVSVMQTFFQAGLPEKSVPPETSRVFLEKGYCYGGFRSFPTGFGIPILGSVRTILLVRDPRDMLVSHYFSMRDSHPEPGKALECVKIEMGPREWAQTMEIDEYVMKLAPTYRRYLAEYRDLLCEKHDVRVYRYEDVIYEKVKWVSDMVAYFGWPNNARQIENIAGQRDRIPDAEDTKSHVRQVHPGNFKVKLKPRTGIELYEFTQSEMEYFGYGQEGATHGAPAIHELG